MGIGRLRATACAALAAALLSACGMDNRYYVKTDRSIDALAGITQLTPPATAPAPLELGVTFKSEGKVVPTASDTLYQSVSNGLSAKGRWNVRRLGHAGDDFTPAIAAITRVSAGAAVAQRRAAASAPAPQRLLVLVENAPDLTTGTLVNYFLSGMSIGAHGVHRATDRYDITIAYRDAQGVDRIYRSHQDLLLATGSRIFGRDDSAVAGLKHYDTALDAFNGVVDNSVNGARHGVVTIGQPRFSTLGQSATH